MNPAERERHLQWLMTLRVVIVTTLLVSAFAIELLFRPVETLRPLFLLAATAYGMALVYAVADRWLAGTRSFLLAQLVGDAVIVSLFVQITGGLDSPMSFLYVLPVSVASILLYRAGGLALAGVSYALYAGMITFGAPWRPLGSALWVPEPEPSRLVYFLVAHGVAFVVVALLASSLAERLRAQRQELGERRAAVARLQALNENIIESINSGLITTDLGGRVHFINRGGTEITGLGQAAVEGRPLEELIGLGSEFFPEARRRLSAERRFRFEIWFPRPDGRRILMGIAVSNLYDKAGRPLGFIFIFQDLTEIHLLEQEVRLRERMVALGEMAAGMAHELRNPLAAISGSVQYLKGDLRPQGETLELMDIILRESQRLDQAIRDFLTFARPGEFAPEHVDLVRLLEDNVKLLRNSREFGPGHRVATRWAEPSLSCEVDPNRLKQVFWNLATNALKAMPDGGTLALTLARIDGGRGVELCFEDEGVGMDERQLAHYFQPFSSSFGEGTGLGAAIVYRLVEEHGGRIDVASRPGRGTRVRIVLPARQTRGAEHAMETRRVAAGG